MRTYVRTDNTPAPCVPSHPSQACSSCGRRALQHPGESHVVIDASVLRAFFAACPMRVATMSVPAY